MEEEEEYISTCSKIIHNFKLILKIYSGRLPCVSQGLNVIPNGGQPLALVGNVGEERPFLCIIFLIMIGEFL
jgi:hypothetical protein